LVFLFLGGELTVSGPTQAKEQKPVLKLRMRTRVETGKNSKRYHTLVRPAQWDPRKTVVIVCDVWDLHHCLNAVRRLEEFAPRLNKFLKEGRARGMTIIHAPSDCIDAYKEHPARKRTLAMPRGRELPREIGSWCSRIPAEERGKYPIDQSDGGEDDDPAEHRAWAKKLQSMGRNPRAPWKKQSALITIEDKDYISDKGEEVWSILTQRGIDNVILTGVHTNMCVLGRPFGLRQMARNGKKVVLVRDLTDTMYNPQRWPFVSHFTGTDLIVEHIEKFVCPTITSDQLLGGKPFRFKNDKRPHVVLVMAEDEYRTEKTLPDFAARFLDKDFRVSKVFSREHDRDDVPGLEVIDDTDVLLVSVRRRLLKTDQLAIIRRYVKAGKPVLGIRTASHAFAPLSGKVPRGHAAWLEFDKEVLGGNYHGHHGSGPKGPQTYVQVSAGAKAQPLLIGVRRDEFPVTSSLYKTSPLAKGTKVLLTGRAGDLKPQEPVAWTFTRKDGGRSFYASLGDPKDFALLDFQRLLVNAVYWGAGLPVPKNLPVKTGLNSYKSHWHRMPVPGTWAEGSHGVLKDWNGPAWYRCLVRVPRSWSGRDLTVVLGKVRGTAKVFLNGQRAAEGVFTSDEKLEKSPTYRVPANGVEPGELNLLAVQLTGPKDSGLATAPKIHCGKASISLCGDWQFRIGNDLAWSRYPLPAKFAAATDVIFEGTAGRKP
jgi:nicotinamidase-related amidase